MSANRLLIALQAMLMLVAGCASRPVNESITQNDPNTGYRANLLMPKRTNNDPHTLFVLAFSGGGTRAAALSYVVLAELRRTEVVVDGYHRLARIWNDSGRPADTRALLGPMPQRFPLGLSTSDLGSARELMGSAH